MDTIGGGDTVSRRRSYSDGAIAIGIGLAAFIVYILTLAPSVLPGDSGEFQLAAPLMGLAHPTGYPLYLLLGKLWTVLMPIGDMAYRMNLLSAVCAALTIIVLFALERQMGLEQASSALGALTLAFSLTFWSQAIRAEVYALNSLLTVLLLLLALQPRSRRNWLVLVFVLGLSLAHHRMILLFVPTLLIIALSRQSTLERRRRMRADTSRLLYLAVFVLPLLLYLYIPVRAPATPYLRLPVGGGPELMLYENSLGDFITMVMGNAFRGSLKVPDATHLVERLVFAFGLLRQQVGVAGIALAVLGLLYVLRRDAAVGLGFILAYVVVVAFCIIYSIGDIADLFTSSYVIVALYIGAGLNVLAEFARNIAKIPARAIVLLAALALPLILLVGNWQTVDMSQYWTTRLFWENILRQPLPDAAILVSDDRDQMIPMWYLQHIEGVRRDLVGLFPKIKPEPEFETIGTLLDWLLARGQQPYLIKPMPGLEIKYQVQGKEEGQLWRVVGHAAPDSLLPDRTVGVSFANAVELTGADVRGPMSAGSELAVTLYWRPLMPMAENYHTFVHLVNAAGERLTGSDHRPGDVFYPTSLWRGGDILMDQHVLEIPATLEAGTYYLRVGIYHYPSLERLRLTGSEQTTIDLGPVVVSYPMTQ